MPDEIVEVVYRFIDRMNDVAPDCGDPADRILNEFTAAMNPVLARHRLAATVDLKASNAALVEVTFEVWQDDMLVASSTNENDARHYLAVYSQDGPAKLMKAVTTRAALQAYADGEKVNDHHRSANHADR